MAQQDTTAAGSGTAVAGASLSGNQLHFLTQTKRWGVDCSPELGLNEHSVLVFQGEDSRDSRPVVLCIKSNDFALQENLTADEARVLAAALRLAADQAEQQAFDQDVAVAMKAAKVAP